MKNLIRTVIAAVFMSGACSPLHANEASNLLSADAARQVVQEFVESVQSYQADFTQVLLNNSGEALEEEAGQLWLLRPGQFRWEYVVPWERQIVANEESIWLYDAELEQVTVQSAEGALLASPAALLVGDMTALEDYGFSGNRKADGAVMVTLKPLTGHGDFVAIGLGFAAEELVLLELYDRFDQHTVIHFSNIIRNPSLNPELFNFELPNGADVIDQRID
jgi:outer membrane lipoprotein carrier protein